MKNWSGIIYLAADHNGLRSLVMALEQPIKEKIKNLIFSFFNDIISINMSYDEERTKRSLKYINFDNLLNIYMVMVLQAFFYTDLHNVLNRLCLSNDIEISTQVNLKRQKIS